MFARRTARLLSLINRRAQRLHVSASRCGRLAADFFDDDEIMMRDSIARMASEEISPLVSKMDKQGFMEQSVLDALFSSGVSCIDEMISVGI